MHCSQDVRFGGLTHGVLLVVGQGNHVLPLVSEEFVQIGAHVLYIVYAPTKLTSLPKVVDAYEKCFSPAVASRVLEGVSCRRAVAKSLHSLGWRRRGIVVSVCVWIAIDAGHTFG